jgi:hypothetical protein
VEKCPENDDGPELGTRGLHSESGGGRGLTAWDAVCVVLILAISDLVVQIFFKVFFGRGIEPRKEKKPRAWEARGSALRGVDGGRGLTVLGCCLVDPIVAI